jgi:hypothetical protein
MRALFASLLFAAVPAEPVDYLPALQSRGNQAEMFAAMFARPGDELWQAYFLGRRDAFREAEAIIRYERRRLTN